MRIAPIALISLLMLIMAPAPYTQNDTITVAARGWSGYQTELIRDAVRRLSRLGPHLVMVECSETQCQTADVEVRHLSTPHCEMAGIYSSGLRYVQVDPVCTPGAMLFEADVEHELGHFLGMKHICVHRGDNPTCDDAAGYGIAIMNPSLPEFLDSPTALDATEFRLAQTRHNGESLPFSGL